MNIFSTSSPRTTLAPVARKRRRTAGVCVLLGAMLLPLLAQAGPGLLDAPADHAQAHGPGEAGAHDMVGAEIPTYLLNRASDIHSAKKLARRLHYTSVPGEGALSGIRLGMSAGHGIHWDNGAWRFQRGINDYSWGGLREDIQTNQLMIDYLLDMVERAGAETVTMRARNYGETALIVDNDAGSGFEETGSWQSGGSDGFGGTYRYASLAGGDASQEATVRWKFEVDEDGEYPIYAYFLASNNRTDAANYKVNHVGGHTSRTLSQAELLVQQWPRADYPNNPPGATAARLHNDIWHYIGTFPFKKGVSYSVELSNRGSNAEKVIIADAIRIGAGEGFIKGGNGQPSGRPRWEEASVPYIDWVGAPSWLKVGDVSGRPLYAIYRGVDAYLAVHTNAGGGTGTSTYTWYDEQWVSQSNWRPGFARNNLPPGTVEWGDSIHAEIIRQARARWDSGWTNRGRKGSNFGELRAFRQGWKNDKNAGVANPLSIPAALIELAFHDTDSDGRFLREMEFRHDTARGMLVGIIRHFKGSDALIPPLPPSALYTRVVGDQLKISWKPTADSVYPNSDTASYRVYTSRDGLLFDPKPIEVSGTSTTLPLSGCEPLYVRVTAVNAAGESLDSRVVGGAKPFEGGARVLYVDGVKREVKAVAAPNNPRTYARIYGPAMRAARAGTGFEMATDDAAAQAITDRDYDVVVWAAGETSTRKETFSLEAQQVVVELLNRGSRLLVSGAEIGWDLVEKGSSADKDFYKNSLGATFVADDAGTTKVDASALGLGSLTFGDCSRDATCIGWPDVIAPESGGAVLLSYSQGAAGVESADKQKIMVGFPLETVADPADRKELIAALVGRLLQDAGQGARACSEVNEPGEDAGNSGADAGNEGEKDAGHDAWNAPDVGSNGPDAGVSADADRDGESDTETVQARKLTNDGCGCAATGDHIPAGGAVLAVFAGLLGIARRRKLD